MKSSFPNLNSEVITLNQVSNELKKFRYEIGLSQTALAERVQVTRQTIFAIEKGKIVPSIKLALKLALYFDTSVEALFSLEERVRPGGLEPPTLSSED